MEEKDVQLHEEASLHLWKSVKWMKFMAVLMIISAAFLVLGGIMMLVLAPIYKSVTEAPMGLLGVLYLVMAIVEIFPIIYLLRACKSGKTAAEDNDNEAFVAFMKNNKDFWKFLGILSIVMIALSIVVLPIVMISAL